MTEHAEAEAGAIEAIQESTEELTVKFGKILNDLKRESSRIVQLEETIRRLEEENSALGMKVDQKEDESKILLRKIEQNNEKIRQLDELKEVLEAKENDVNKKQKEIETLKGSNEFLARLLVFVIFSVPLGLYAEHQLHSKL